MFGWLCAQQQIGVLARAGDVAGIGEELRISVSFSVVRTVRNAGMGLGAEAGEMVFVGGDHNDPIATIAGDDHGLD